MIGVDRLRGLNRHSAVLLLVPLLLLTLAGPAAAQEVTFTAEVDSQKIGLDETVDLTVTISGSSLAQSINPVMPDLPDFDIAGTSQSSNISFVNGQISASRSIVYTLTPKKTGMLTIPPVRLTYGGKEYTTSPVEVEVVAGSTGKQQRRSQSPWSPFFNPFEDAQPTQRLGQDSVQLVAELDRRQVYQGQQATFSIKVLTQVSVTGLQVEDFPPLTGFWVEDLQVEKNPSGKRVMINDRDYVEFLVKRNAIFPSRPGRFTIGAATFAIQTDGGGGFFSGSQIIRRRSKPLSIEVLPLPDAGRPAGFAGVVGTFGITAKLDKTSVALGDVATLSIAVSGRGNLKTISAPQLPSLDDFKVYDPKYTERISTTSGVMEGDKSWEYVLSPKAKGVNQIAPIALPFFDPVRRTYQVARTQPLTLTVEGGMLPAGTAAVGDRSQLRALRRDISYIRTEDTGIRPSAAFPPVAYVWILLPPLLNLVAFGYRRYREDRTADLASYLRSRAFGQFKRSLKKTRALAHPAQAKDFYRALNDGLARYAAHKLSLSPQGLTLQGILQRLDELRVDPAVVQRFQAVWNDAEFGLFAAGSPGLNAMEKLLREAEQAVGAIEEKL